MENPSNQVSELKKGHFEGFEIFFWKIMVFRCENGKFFFINTFCSEKSRNVFQTWFGLIFTTLAHQNGQNRIFDDFWPFLVIFGGSPKMANPDVSVSPNLNFLAKIRFSGSKTIFEMIWVSRNLLVKTRLKIELKNFLFSTMEISSNFRSDLTRAPNKHLPKWNFAPIDAVGTVQDHQGLSGDAFGHDKLGHSCPKST